MAYSDGLGTSLPLLVRLPDGRDAWVSLHAQERARARIGRDWLRRLGRTSRVERWPAREGKPAAAAYVAPDGATFVAVEGDGDGLSIVTAYAGAP